jgi:glycosyltransferase involved in cell wall biosynthesis
MPGPTEPAVAIVIPAYQAAGSIARVVSGVERVVPSARCYVADDGSSDGTAEAAAGGGAAVVLRLRHGGKGAALAAGVGRALADGAAVLVTLDADGQHPPALIPQLVAPVVAGTADIVLGARSRTAEMPAGRRFTNWLSAAIASRVGRTAVPDAQTGFRAFARRVGETVRPRERHYDYEAAFLLEALAAGLRVRSVPIPTIYDGGRSHFHAWADSWRVARVFARYGGRMLAGPRCAS